MRYGLQEHRAFPLPGDRARYARDRTCDVRHIKLEVSLDLNERRLWGSVSTTLAPINDGLTRVEFDAVELDIKSVALADGSAPLDFEVSDDKLRVDLGDPRPAGEQLTIVVEYECRDPRRGLYFIAPDEAYPDRPLQAWTQGQDEDSRHWFPCYDFPNEQATSEVVVTVPEPLTVVSNGLLTAVEVTEKPRKGGPRLRTFRWRQDVPHVSYLLSLVVGEFARVGEQWDGIPVEYYMPPGREEDGRRAFGKTPEMLRFFSERIGIRYPYAKYAQVAVHDFIFGGMENVSATTVTHHALHDERAHLDYSADPLVAHELAHQWYGDLLTCRDWAHAWLNEGFATYFDLLFKEHDLGVDEFRYAVFLDAESYFEEDRDRYRRPIVSNVYHEPIDLFDRHLYEKGGLVLHMLRFVLGDELFWKAIRHYTAKHRGTNVVTTDLQRAIEEATGRNLDWFFDQWVYAAGHPDLKAEYSWDDEAKSARLSIKQTQPEGDGTPVFRLPMDVAFTTSEGVHTFRIDVREREQSFHFPLPAKPVTVRLDPGNWTLKTLDFTRPKELLLHQLQHDPDVMGRIEAAKALAKLGTLEIVAALKRAVLEDPFWGVQAEAAKVLGKVRSKAALEALAECLTVRHPKARRGAVRGLGEFRDEAAAHALLPVLKRDKSYYVEAEAAKSLGKTRSPQAFEALEKALAKDSHNEVIRYMAFEGLGELRDERAVPLCIEWTRYGRPPRARQGAVLALGKLAEALGSTSAAGQRIFDRLVELLDDPWLQVRLQSVISLQDIGEAKAVPHLEALAARELDGRIVRRAREAALRLRESRQRSDEVRRLREDVEKLQQDNRELRDRVDRLEAEGTGK
jgi:aminopeptidase N